MEQITPTLWINDKLEEAAEFYCSLFRDSQVTGSNDYGPDAGPYAGQKMVIRLELQGQPHVLLNGGDTSFTPNESVSFAVGCESQDEVDRLWEALEDAGFPVLVAGSRTATGSAGRSPRPGSTRCWTTRTRRRCSG